MLARRCPLDDPDDDAELNKALLTALLCALRGREDYRMRQ